MKTKREPVYFSIEKDKKQLIDKMCEQTGYTRSQLLRMMVSREMDVDIPAETCCVLTLAEELGKENVDIQRAQDIVSELIKMKGVL